MEAVSRLGPNGEGGGGNFVTGNTLHTVQRSRYGRRLAQNMTREIRPARNLVNTAGRHIVRVTSIVTEHYTLNSRPRSQATD